AFGVRWGPGALGSVSNDPAAGGIYSVINGTALCTQVASFLCPSDGNPGRAGNSQIIIGQANSPYTATGSYPSNLGLNRGYNNWSPNGPPSLSGSWDNFMKRTVALNNFQDGTSNTAIFSEWIKGKGIDPATAPDGLSMVYSLQGGGVPGPGGG